MLLRIKIAHGPKCCAELNLLAWDGRPNLGGRPIAQRGGLGDPRGSSHRTKSCFSRFCRMVAPFCDQWSARGEEGKTSTEERFPFSFVRCFGAIGTNLSAQRDRPGKTRLMVTA